MPFGSGFPNMPGYAMPGFMGQGYPGMDQTMSQMMDRATFMHRCMITMSNIATEISRACQLLAQNPSQIGMPFPGYPTPPPGFPPAPNAAPVPGDAPVDMEALKQALAGMDPMQAQKALYAVQMMQWFGAATRGGQPANAAPSAAPAKKDW